MVLVCVCVCLRERERERERQTAEECVCAVRENVVSDIVLLNC